jgi:hypothetical protein
MRHRGEQFGAEKWIGQQEAELAEIVRGGECGEQEY